MASSIQHIKANFNRDILIGQADDTDNNDVTGICILSKKHLVVVDGNSLKLIDLEMDKVVSEYQMKMTGWDVTNISDDVIAVTLPFDKQIIILRLDESGQFSIDHESTASELCYGVQYCENSLIVSHYGDNSRLEILDMADNSVIKTYENDESKGLEILRPEYIALNKYKANIYISDWMNQTVTSLSLEGRVNAIATEFEEPKGVTTNKYGNVLVSDYGSNNVFILTEDLDERKVLIDSNDGIQAPQCLVFSNITNQLFVGQENSNVIKVFDIVDNNTGFKMATCFEETF